MLCDCVVEVISRVICNSGRSEWVSGIFLDVAVISPPPGEDSYDQTILYYTKRCV